MIKVYEPSLTEVEHSYLLGAFNSGWISSQGAYLNDFEGALAKYLSDDVARPCVQLVSNGTVALHLALKALGVGSGDEVLVPSLTYIATVNSILYCGAKPVFVDVNEADWNLNIVDLLSKLTPSSKAILCVHLFGFPCDMDKIMEVAEANGLSVIEDAAEALGSEYKNKKLGSIGDVGTFSFFGNKTITTGEGGAVYCKDPEHYALIGKLKSQGNSKTTKFWHDELGYNYRLTNLQAAIGCAQMSRLDWILEQKDRVHQTYKNSMHDSFKWQSSCDLALVNVWMNTVIVPERVDRDGLMSFMLKHGVETRPMFFPAHRMPYLKMEPVNLPNTEKISSRGISLPSSPLLTESQIKRITALMNEFLAVNGSANS